MDRLKSLILVWQLVLEKENSEFKLVTLLKNRCGVIPKTQKVLNTRHYEVLRGAVQRKV